MTLIDALSKTVRTQRGHELRAAAKASSVNRQDEGLAWEALVAGQQSTTANSTSRMGSPDPFGGALTPDEGAHSSHSSPSFPSQEPAMQRLSLSSQSRTLSSSSTRNGLGARPVPAASFNSSAFNSSATVSTPTLTPINGILQPSQRPMASFAPPATTSTAINWSTPAASTVAWSSAPAAPSLPEPINPWSSTTTTTTSSYSSTVMPNYSSQPVVAAKTAATPSWNVISPPGFTSNSVLVPQRSTAASKGATNCMFVLARVTCDLNKHVAQGPILIH